MKDTPSISVVVVSYNFAPFLRECLDSLVAQTLRPSEIIVYDDCSTDASWDIIEEYAQRHPDLFVVHRQPANKGMHANINEALARAGGELVSWMDGDDRWMPRKLEREWQALQSDPSVRVAYSNVWQLDASGHRTGMWDDGSGPPPPQGDVFAEVFAKRFFPACRSVFRNHLMYRSDLEQLCFHDTAVKLYIDWDLKIRTAHRCRFAYTGEALVEYRIHPGGIHNRALDVHRDDLVYIVRKNLPLLQERDATQRAFVLEGLRGLAREYGIKDLSFIGAAPIESSVDGQLPQDKLPCAALSNAQKGSYLGEDLVFLVSMPRSGSTLLQNLLAGHTDIHTEPEPWLMLHWLYSLKDEGIRTEYEHELWRRATRKFFDTLPGGEEDYLDGIRALARVVYGRAREAAGKRFFLDKTPRYFYILPELMRVFPRAKILLLCRNPLAVMGSMLRTWFDGDPAAFRASSHYPDLVEGVRNLSRAIEGGHEQIHVVRYEALLAEPDRTLRSLCDFLRIEFNTGLLDYGAARLRPSEFGDQARIQQYDTVVSRHAGEWRGMLANPAGVAVAREALDTVGEAAFLRLGCPREDLESLRGGGQEENSADALNARGEQAFTQNDPEQAARLFRQALEIDPRHVDALNNLAVLYWAQGDQASALEQLALAYRTDPGHPDVACNLVSMLDELGYQGEAQAVCSAYLELSPGDTRMLDIKARLQAAEEPVVEAAEPPAEQPGPGRLPDSGEGAEIVCEIPGEGEVSAWPLISVVVPSFNQAPFLEQTLCSVLEQGYPNLELIVLDGGSTDGSVDIIRKYESHIRFWRSHPDDGQYAAVNEGLQRCRGDIMTWINSDDILLPGSLYAAASVFLRRPEVEWITGRPSTMDELGRMRWVCDPPPLYSRHYYLSLRFDYPKFIQQEGTFWRRSLWEKAGGRLATRLHLAGDLELWMRFFRHARLYTVDHMLGRFRQHSTQKTASQMAQYREEAVRLLKPEAEAAGAAACATPAFAPVIRLQGEIPQAAAGAGTIGAAPDDTSGAGSQAQPEPLVTAIVSTYNSAGFLPGCLDDLMAQTVADRLEVIVVDSGSQQNEGEIVRQYQQRFPQIRYIRTEQRETIYAAWNRAIREARGRYITNANTDDRHRCDALERMAQTLECQPAIALVYADSRVTRQPNASFDTAPVTGHFRWPEFAPELLFSQCYVGPQPMWRRELHARYGEFDESMSVAGDYDFWLRMAFSETFLHLPEELGLYLQHAASIEHANAEAAARESELARQRNWPVSRGARPAPGGCWLVPAGRGQAAGGGPRVSIIMPTRDRRELIGRAIDSVLAQTLADWELIIVNDGGESVQDIVDGRTHGGRIRLIELPEPGGQAAARNRALRAARGQYICYLDDDDRFLPQHLETLVRFLDQGEYEFVYTDAQLIGEYFEHGALRRSGEQGNPYGHEDFSRARLLVNNYIPINTWAHRASCLEQVGYFDESLDCYEDWEFLLRFSARGDFLHIPKTTAEVMYRIDRVDNVTRNRLAQTADTYRMIYERHREGVDATLERQREARLRALDAALADRVEEDPVPTGEKAVAESRLEAIIQGFMRTAQQKAWRLPAVHLFMPVPDGAGAALADSLDSLSAQVYGGWGLSLFSRAPAPDGLDELPMIEWVQCDEPETALGRALAGSSADWIGLLRPGDRLEPTALSCLVEYINAHADILAVYTDEDICDAAGQRLEHRYKPDADPFWLRSTAAVGALLLLRRDAFSSDALPGADAGPMPGEALFHAQLLHLVESPGVQAIGHLQECLVHRLEGNERAADPASWLGTCVEAHLARLGVRAPVRQGVVPGTCMVEYPPPASARVCIAVAVRDETAETLYRSIALLREKTRLESVEIRIGLSPERAGEFSRLIDHRTHIDLRDDKATVDDWYRSLSQAGRYDYLVLLAPGCMALQDNWLQRMLGLAAQPGVGVVGARLVSPAQRVAHAGLALGVGDLGVAGVLGCPGRGAGASMDEAGYLQGLQLTRCLSAVSNQIMLVDAALMREVGGFDPELAVEIYRSVDFCLKVRRAGRDVVFTPHVSFLVTGDRIDVFEGEGGSERVASEAARIRARWLDRLANDRAGNRNLSLQDVDHAEDAVLGGACSRDVPGAPRVSACGFGSWAAWSYRIRKPLEVLADAGQINTTRLLFKQALPTPVELARACPEVLLLYNAVHEVHIERLREYRHSTDARLVFSLDDLLYDVPEAQPDRPRDIKKRIRKALDLSDTLLVTSEYLAEELSGFIQDIRVLPNLLDRRVWRPGEIRERKPAVRPRVGWAGAMQHASDLHLLCEVVRQTAEEIDWVFMGMCPQAIRPFVTEVHDYVPFDRYPDALARLRLDLALAPLAHNRFNRCKSNLRLLEYGMMGWPVLASDIEPYRDAPVQRLRNRPRDWIRAIRGLLADEPARLQAAQALQQWVLEHYLLQSPQNLARWMQALDLAPAGSVEEQGQRVVNLA